MVVQSLLMLLPPPVPAMRGLGAGRLDGLRGLREAAARPLGLALRMTDPIPSTPPGRTARSAKLGREGRGKSVAPGPRLKGRSVTDAEKIEAQALAAEHALAYLAGPDGDLREEFRIHAGQVWTRLGHLLVQLRAIAEPDKRTYLARWQQICERQREQIRDLEAQIEEMVENQS